MRSIVTKSLVGFLFAVFIVAVAGETRALAVEITISSKSKTTETGTREPVSYIQLRSLMMDFADRYIQMIGQAVDTLQKQNTDPSLRVGIHSMKLFPCSAAFSIAIDQSPRVALLDMEVMVHLQGMVWRETAKKRFGDKADAFLAVQKSVEDDIDAIALKVLSPDQLKELHALIEEWRKEHPDQRYVSYIRLSDFSELRQGGYKGKSGTNLLSIAGILSAFQIVNMDETTRSVDQARMVAERAIYLSQRMPTLLRWQTEMCFYEMAATPEAKNFLATSQALRELPGVLAAERKDAIAQLGREADNHSRAIIWEITKTALLILFTIFVLAVLYQIIVKRLK